MARRGRRPLHRHRMHGHRQGPGYWVGEWPGYYTSCGPEPVLQVKAIYHRNDPIQVAQPPARPIYPGTYFGTAGSALLRAASLWDDLEAAGVPGIRGVWKMPGGGSRFINVIAIEQMHAGHA